LIYNYDDDDDDDDDNNNLICEAPEGEKPLVTMTVTTVT